MPAGRTLTRRELLLALLDRQLLLKRTALAIPEVLERMGGLQAQYAPSMYIGLWTRMRRFARQDLDDARTQRTVVQGTLLRSTIHLVSARDYWLFAAAIRPSRKQWWLQARKADAAALDHAVVTLRAFLRAADGPQKPKAVKDATGVEMEAFNQWTELVRVPPSATWRRRQADLYALAEDWIAPPKKPIPHDDAVEHVVRRYLGGFGPATTADIASWAGVTPKLINATVDRMGNELRTFLSEAGDVLVDLRRMRIPDEETPVPVRFLPVWDATMLVHARRTGILPEEYRPNMFNTKNPHSFNTFLVDGEVAGTWKHTPTGVELNPYKKLPKATRSALEEEAEGLDALHR